MRAECEIYFDNSLNSDDRIGWAQKNVIDMPLSRRVEMTNSGEPADTNWYRLAKEWSMIADARYRACVATRPSMGEIRVGVKDTVDVVGLPTGLGLRRYRHYPQSTAPILRSIEESICAKLVTTELNVGVGSGCLNPYFPEVDPAGSSTGCGVAVAAGICDVAFGTDVLGSVRWPAGRCGVVGLRETHGLRDRNGIFPLAPSMDAPGWVTRTADDLAFAWNYLKIGRILPAKGLRIAVVVEARNDILDREISEGLELASRALVSAGHTVYEESIGDIWNWRGAAWELCAHDLWHGYQFWNSRLNDSLSASTRESIALGEAITKERYGEIVIGQRQLRETNLLGATDAWLLPLDAGLPRKLGSGTTTVSTIPSRGDTEYERKIGYTPLASFAGLPAITFPVGIVEQVPLSMQLIGPPESEGKLISLAQDIDRTIGNWKRVLR